VGLLIPCSQGHGGSNPSPRAFLIKFKSALIHVFVIGTKKNTKNYQGWSKKCNYWHVSRM